MSLNKTIRKRSLPEWMKDTSQSSCINKSKLSPNRKAQGPSYPPISVKKVKRFPRHVEKSPIFADDQNITGADGNFSDDDERNDLVVETQEKPGTSSELISPSFDESDPELDVFLTVEDLTRVAQEVINEEMEKERISHSAQKHTLP